MMGVLYNTLKNNEIQGFALHRSAVGIKCAFNICISELKNENTKRITNLFMKSILTHTSSLKGNNLTTKSFEITLAPSYSPMN
jgi:hypothetical protein